MHSKVKHISQNNYIVVNRKEFEMKAKLNERKVEQLNLLMKGLTPVCILAIFMGLLGLLVIVGMVVDPSFRILSFEGARVGFFMLSQACMMYLGVVILRYFQQIKRDE